MYLRQTMVNCQFTLVSDVVDVGIPRLLLLRFWDGESREGGLNETWPECEFFRASFVSS